MIDFSVIHCFGRQRELCFGVVLPNGGGYFDQRNAEEFFPMVNLVYALTFSLTSAYNLLIERGSVQASLA